MHGPVLTVVEDVWGVPFDELAAEVGVLREPDAWKDRDRLRELASSAPAITVRNRTQVDTELLTGAPGLRVVLRAGVGLENIDVKCADVNGVVVVSPRDANALSVAEHTVALALALARDVVAHDAAVRSGLWQRSPGQELSGRVWGLLGAGGTGRAVARIVHGLGMRVLAYDPYADTSAARAEGIELGALDDVVGAADVLSVHLPGGAATQGLVGADLLARTRPGCLLVNVGRGDVVDEAALAESLHSGHLGGAALDVRAQEPPQPGPLDDAPRLILTPHVAGITEQSQYRIAQRLVDNLRGLLRGERAPDAVGAVDRVPEWVAT